VLFAEVANEGPARARVAYGDEPALALYYGGEHGGSMDTCGCPQVPRGSLARAATYLHASQRMNPTVPSVVVHAGGWLSDTIGDSVGISDDALVANNWMIDGLAAGGWEVFNVGSKDLPHLAAHGFPEGAVSANLRPIDTEGPPTHIVLERGGLRVAVTGVSAPVRSLLAPEGFEALDPLQSLSELVARIEADVVVVLAYQLPELAQEIARIEGVDVVVEAAEYRARYEPYAEGDTVWVRSRFQTERLGGLRLWFDDDGRLLAARDRVIDLDPAVRSEPTLARMARKARVDRDHALQASAP
jgi:5'-nucleotidase